MTAKEREGDKVSITILPGSGLSLLFRFACSTKAVQSCKIYATRISNVLNMPATVSCHPYLVFHCFSYLIVYCSRYPLHPASTSYTSLMDSAGAFHLIESHIHLPNVSFCCCRISNQLIVSIDQLLIMRLTDASDRVPDDLPALERSVSTILCCDASELRTYAASDPLFPVPYHPFRASLCLH